MIILSEKNRKILRDEILQLEPMCFTPFNGNSCNSQLYFCQKIADMSLCFFEKTIMEMQQVKLFEATPIKCHLNTIEVSLTFFSVKMCLFEKPQGDSVQINSCTRIAEAVTNGV